MWTAKEVAFIGETLNNYDIEDILTSEELYKKVHLPFQ